MQKQTRTPRNLALTAAGAVAFAMAWSWPVAAQTAPDERPAAPEAAETPESPSDAAIAPSATREERLDAMFAALAAAGPDDHERIEEEIARLWSRSGSDSMDLLLQRGRDALSDEKTVEAIHLLSALVEHAPDFAEGWNARATAYYIHGDWGLSLADIEQTLRLEPRHFGALAGLGMILEQIDRKAEALKAFRAADAINPNLKRVHEAIRRLAPEVDGRDI